MAQGRSQLAAVTLDDKYILEKGRVYLTGTQALVRLPMLQRQRDAAAGLNTGVLYLRLSRLAAGRARPGAVGRATLHRAQPHPLSAGDQRGAGRDRGVGQPAGRAVSRRQIRRRLRHVVRQGTRRRPQRRCAEARQFRRLGAAWRRAGCSPATTTPANPRPWRISRNSPSSTPRSRCSTRPGSRRSSISASTAGRCRAIPAAGSAFKTVAETVDSSASVAVDPGRVEIVLPDDFEMPPGGLNIRWPDPPLEQELRLHRYKLAAARGLRPRQPARPHRASTRRQPRFGIVTTGKSYLDVRQALDDLGIGAAEAARDRHAALQGGDDLAARTRGRPPFRRRARGGAGRRGEARASSRTSSRSSSTTGRRTGGRASSARSTRAGEWLLPSNGELTPDADRARDRPAPGQRFGSRAAARRAPRAARRQRAPARRPRSCRSSARPISARAARTTPRPRCPEGSRALAGIGCHYMAQFMDRDDRDLHPDGRRRRAVDRPGAVHRDAARLRQSRRRHLYPFRHPGDPRRGRRQGQHHLQDPLQRRRRHDRRPAARRRPDRAADRPARSPPKASRPIVVVTDEPDKYPLGTDFPPGATIRHRDELDAVQRELRELPGVTAIVYDQTCAAEKRRRRKRGRFPDPPKRVFINELVCEGCGDCSANSNCLSVEPVETEFGRKRAIDQSSCNKDFSCLKGFCPSFVTVEGGSAAGSARPAISAEDGLPPLPEPALPRHRRALRHPRHRRRRHRRRHDRRAARHGGASRRQGRHRARHDRPGAEGRRGDEPCAHRRAARGRSTPCASPPAAPAAARLRHGGVGERRGALQARAGAQPRDRQQPRDDHRRLHPQPRLAFPGRDLRAQRSPPRSATAMPSSSRRRGSRPALLGDSIATNLFMLGYAYQQGLVPVSAEAIERAIELNGVAVDVQPQRLPLGPARRARPRVGRGARASRRMRCRRATGCRRRSTRLVGRRVEFLTRYQNAAYAAALPGRIARGRARPRPRARRRHRR